MSSLVQKSIALTFVAIAWSNAGAYCAGELMIRIINDTHKENAPHRPRRNRCQPDQSHDIAGRYPGIHPEYKSQTVGRATPYEETTIVDEEARIISFGEQGETRMVEI